jgi:YegS/Rv2252/BmrU family lipid kinase
MSDISHFHERARLLIIHNPVAGSRRQKGLAKARAALQALGVEVTDYTSLCAGDAERRARMAADEGFDGIIAAGGDGTLNEVANGVAGRGVAIGLLPLGTANVFAIEAGIPLKADAWARRIAYGRAVPVHLGAADGRYFVAMVSAGFDARAVAGVDKRVKRLFGKAAYGLSGLAALLATGRDRLLVTIDGTAYEAGWAIVAKTRAYAGPFELVPTADLKASALGVTLFPVAGCLSRLLTLLLAGMGRVRAVPGVRFLTGHEVRIESRQEMATQMDGDQHALLPMTVTPGLSIAFLGIDSAVDGRGMVEKDRYSVANVSKKTHVN